MSNILSVPFSRTLLAKAAFFNDVKIMSSLRSFMQVLIRHFTIFQSGWFVQKNWEKLSKFVEVTAKILSVPFLWQGVCIYVTVNVYISWFTQELYMFTENVRKYTYFLKFGSDFCTDLLSGNFFHECICEYGEKWAISNKHVLDVAIESLNRSLALRVSRSSMHHMHVRPQINQSIKHDNF